MDSENENVLQDLIHIYRTSCPDDAKVLRNAVEDGKVVVMMNILFKNLKTTSEPTSEDLLHGMRFAYFLNYCMKYNNGIPLIEIFNDIIDIGKGIRVSNAVISQKNLIEDLLKKGVNLEIFKDYVDEKEIIEFVNGMQKKSTKALKLRLNSNAIQNKALSESSKQQEQHSIPEKEQTKSDKLKSELTKYSFFELPLVKQISTDNQAKLVELISSKKIPYAIAMFDFLGFLKYLEKEHYPIKYKLNTEISNWFNSDSRTIKGNISSLLKNTTEDKDRYTAYLHKETVGNDYQSLKKGVLP